MIKLTFTLIAVIISSPALAGGDAEYGEYLSAECVTCHAPVATGKIPSIIGMDAEGFIHIMQLYRSKELENPAMQTVAKRLTDEDIKSLAAYYSSLTKAD